MQQRGRKSAAKLSVIAGSIDGRPKPPEELSEAEQEIWNRVVASEAADMLKTAAVQQMLAAYCRHMATVEHLDMAVKVAMLPESEATIKDMKALLQMRRDEAKAAVSIATKLRLTNQARYQPSVANTLAKNASEERKLWQRPA